MKVPVPLSDAFGEDFEKLLAQVCVEQKLLSSVQDLQNKRFLNRSVVPHVERFKELFNRLQEEDAASGLDRYWQKGSNPENLRLAYFLSFMPGNLFRMASVWSELARLGFRWPETHQTLRAIEFGAGPATGACGIRAGEKFAPVGLPTEGNFALIEQDRATLTLGEKWFSSFQHWLGGATYASRPFHRKLEPRQGWLPRQAPKFNLWIMSFVLNEFHESPAELAKTLLDSFDRHLDDEGLVILLEPAMRLQSRRVLELRRELLAQDAARGSSLQLLLPCLGHQPCGALARAEDWCHEEVTWWRPPYLRLLDDLTGLDRKSLPFSYLVFAKTQASRQKWLPALAPSKVTHRLVSPAHAVGPDWEFYWCGAEGKRRLRLKTAITENLGFEPDRGTILVDSEFRGDENASRVESLSRALQ
ncbi:MAG: small ribosomal subunit Rsm22 family protein [Oligoflexia bacterium]